MKMYGPYLRKDGRKHVVIVHDDGRKQTKSWPRVVLEEKLGRSLLPEETVDHIDNDFTNDSPNNLQVLSLSDNVIKAARLKPRKIYSFVCYNCGGHTSKWLNNVKGNLEKGKRGPFCGRKCAGQATYKNPWAK